MKRLLIAVTFSACAAIALAPMPAQATFHLWTFDEVYSNADGTIQFIEMTNAFDFEQFVSTHALTSTTHTFTPSMNLPAVNNMTAGHHMLFGTAAYAATPGSVAPDYIIADQFFSPAGDTLNWAGFDIQMFGAIPTDGVTSRLLPGTSTAVNSPTNFAIQNGVLNPGDYNGNHVVDAADYTIWRDRSGQAVTAGSSADGNVNGTIDAGDYTFWKMKFGNAVPGTAFGTVSSAVPEPLAAVLISVGLALLALRRRR